MTVFEIKMAITWICLEISIGKVKQGQDLFHQFYFILFFWSGFILGVTAAGRLGVL